MSVRSIVAAILICIGTSAIASADVREQDGRRGTVTGIALDSRSHEPLGGVEVAIALLHKRTVTDSTGRFIISQLPTGAQTLYLHRIGYIDTALIVSIPGDSNLVCYLRLAPVELDNLTIVDSSRIYDPSNTARAITVSGRDLQEKLGRTVAETIANEPGIAQRTMGPAPARPVLRGLGGNRLLVLEDGEKTGDLSSTSADHAVVIDPIGAASVEVIRGPAALLFGSNTVGGVVNVRRDRIPSALPSGLSGSVGMQAETVNDGLGGEARFVVPLHRMAIAGGIDGRTSDDLRTPAGKLNRTEIDAHSYYFGGGYFGDRKRLGIEWSRYETSYGIPGGFLGGHEHGVSIELERSNIDSHLEFDIDRGPVKGVSFQTSYNRYFHEELEQADICGVGFGVLQYNGTAQLLLSPGFLSGKGVLGVWGEYRDYAQTCLTFTPDVIERAFATYLYKEFLFSGITARTSLRVDYRRTTPEQPDTNKTGVVRTRDFSGISGGFAVLVPLDNSIGTEVTLMRTFNAPGVEELFSEGPHIAAYSYEIGNANLNAESGISLEWKLRYRSGRTNTEFALFHNWFDGYIYASNTGQYEYGPGETGRLIRYQYHGHDARFYGFEFSAEANLVQHLRGGGNISFVRGELYAGGNLPLIPPPQGNVWISYSPSSTFEGKVRLRAAAHQNKLGEFEEPTDGYGILDFICQYRIVGRTLLHSFVLGVENVGNTTYRNHLSRVKSIMPEAGRNVKLTYTISF